MEEDYMISKDDTALTTARRRIEFLYPQNARKL
jgi:hypothetical protein